MRRKNPQFVYMSTKPKRVKGTQPWLVAKVSARTTVIRELRLAGAGLTGTTATDLFKGKHDAAVRYLQIRRQDEQAEAERGADTDRG